MTPPPAEWSPHQAVWIGFPSHRDLWADDLEPARAEVTAFAQAVHADGNGERVILVAADDEAGAAATGLAGDFADVIVEDFGDIWLRDTGPILLGDGTARLFDFNGWGGKYDLPGDDTIGTRLAARCRLDTTRCDWVLEGGAIDGDGTGLAITTRQCLLNPNRNPGMGQAAIEERLAHDLGLTQIIWLGDGLLNDHTDGHVDNLARFVAPGVVAIPEPVENDPNWQVYQHARHDAGVAGLTLVGVPSPGRILRDEEIVPASYMNFYIGNAAVIVPTYGATNDAAAVATIGALFPDRETIGLRADHILTGGGSFHCISQQIPADVTSVSFI